jgi:tripartite-type tricarboxylate transporter receptor subunit TctC
MRAPAIALAAACLLAPAQAPAQGYPSRALSLVVPFAADTPADNIGRMLARRMAAALKQPVEVVNRDGDGGAVGSQMAARAAPDGHTLLFVTNATMVTAPIFRRNLGYDADSFAPVAITTMTPYIMAVPAEHPARSIGQLTAMSRAAPGRQRYASLGRGSNQFLAGELYQQLAEIELREVVADVPRTTPLQLLQAGQADVLFESFPGIANRIRDGSVRALAVLGHARLPHLPDLATAVEQGQARLAVYQWSGLVVPAGTPDAIVLELNRAVLLVLSIPEVRSVLLQQGLQAMTGSPQDMRAVIQGERVKWATILNRR